MLSKLLTQHSFSTVFFTIPNRNMQKLRNPAHLNICPIKFQNCPLRSSAKRFLSAVAARKMGLFCGFLFDATDKFRKKNGFLIVVRNESPRADSLRHGHPSNFELSTLTLGELNG